MALTTANDHDRTWSSGFTFVLAAVGAAVGLGNIRKFPFVVGVSGGGALFKIWLWMLRIVAPLAILGVLYSSP